MTRWFFILLVLSVAQIEFYRFSVPSFIRIAPRLWLVISLCLLVCEAIRRAFIEIGLEWWSAVMIPFTAYILGEFFPFAFDYPKDEVSKKDRAFPSLLSFSLVFISVAWLAESLDTLFFEAYAKALLISSVSILLSVILSGIHERLLLLNLPKRLEGFPVLLISAALLLISLYGFGTAFEAGNFLVRFR